jgi:ubiquilin
MFGAGGGMPDMAQMQQQLMSNPEMMSNLMNNPMVQGIMSNPEVMRSMIMANPQMRQLMEANPQLNHIFNDPALFEQIQQTMRNPAAMREMMRSQDLALSQIENLPGGFSALRRMYEEVQVRPWSACHAYVGGCSLRE